jgi:hypothetical protein
MRSVFFLSSLVSGLVCPVTGEVRGLPISSANPADRWKIDFKLSLAEAKGKWVFSVDGSTDLPAETVLRARVYILVLLNDPVDGLREYDDEGLVREDDGIQPPTARFTAGAGWFHIDVHEFRRKPYSIRYRAKIHYLPEDQTEAIRLRVGDEEFQRKADLRAGSEEAYETELKERLAEATQQLQVLEKLGLELGDQALQRAWDGAVWTRWKEPAGTTIDGILEENRRRFPIWAVWIEGQSRMRVGALGEFLHHCIAAVDDGEAVRDPERIRTLLRGFLESVEEACDVIGAHVPLNPLKSGPALAAYDRAIAPLRQPAPSVGVLRKSRSDAVTALLDLTSMLQVRRRGYASVNAMAVRLARLCDLIDARAPAWELQEALREHDAAEQDFKAFARLP